MFSATPDKKIGWKELGFEEGQKIICLSNIERDNPHDFWVDKLTIGKWYKIEDLEWRFWDRVCVKGDTGVSEFFPVEFFFNTISEARDKKINEILKH